MRARVTALLGTTAAGLGLMLAAAPAASAHPLGNFTHNPYVGFSVGAERIEVDHVLDAVRSGRAQAGVLLRPATVAQIVAIAHGGERMPPKTTFFAPKPRTGLVFRDLS